MTLKRPSLSFVPPLLPNQTIYSWCAVFHERSGNSSVVESRLQLCGSTRGRWNFHIPSHLDALSASTQLLLGTPEEIVRAATTLSYYTKFRTANVVEAILKQVRGSSVRGLARSLGMDKSGNNVHPPRRSCHECIMEDESKYGFAYWHRDHQLPGVIVCQHHGTELLSIPYCYESKLWDTFLWPRNDWNLTKEQTTASGTADTKITLQRLAQSTADMTCRELAGGYSVLKMKMICFEMLKERNLIGPDDSVTLSYALRDYANHFENVASVPEIAVAMQSSIRPLLLVLRDVDCRVHPLVWVLIIDWLFGGWTTRSGSA